MTGATSVGGHSSAVGRGAVAMGYRTKASGNAVTAIGSDAVANKDGAVAVGTFSKAQGVQAIAIGGSLTDEDRNADTAAQAAGYGSIAVGAKSRTSADYASAFGLESNAAAGATALGYKTVASGNQATAVGSNASSGGSGSLAAGYMSSTTNERAIALGYRAQTSGERGVSVGNYAVATGQRGIAIGSATNDIEGVSTDATTANGPKATGTDSIALGTGAQSSSYDTIAIGSNTLATTSKAIAIGERAKSQSSYTVAIGSESDVQSTADRSVAIGQKAVSTQKESVVLGHESTDRAATAETAATVGTLTYTGFAGQGSTNKGVVSIGKADSERQLINVAAGKIASTSTDAVNGSQLYATNNMISTVANSVKAVIGTPATLSNTGTFTITNLGGTGKTTIDEAIKASITEVQAGNNVTVSNTPGANGQKIYTVNGEKTTLSAGSTGVSVTPGTKDSNNVTNYTVDLSTTTKNTIAKHTTDIGTNKVNIAKNTADIGANTAKINTNTANIAKNTADIATNKTDIATNKAAIAKNVTDITNLGNNTFTLNGDSTSTTAQALNKNGGLSFKVAGDGKYISTAAAGDTVTVSLNEQAIKDAAKSSVKFKVKANANAEEVVNADDTIAFNDGSNIEITQNGTNFTIATKKDVTFDSVVANTFTAGTNVLNGTGLTVGNTAITTAGLTNGNTTITGTGVTTDTVTAGTVNAGSVIADTATIGGKVTINNAGINAGNTVITNVASGGTTDSNAANIGDVKKAVANLSQNLTISDGTTDGTVDLKNQKLTVTGTGAATATVSGQSITVNVAEGKLTPNATDGTVVGSATGVAKAADVASAINNTNTVLTNKIDANTTKINTNTANIATNTADIATNKIDIATNKTAITKNATDIATNKTDIATNKAAIAKNVTDITNLGNNTFTLNGDSTSTTAQALNKNGGLSFKVAGDGKYISTAATGDTVTVSLNEQAIKDTAKFKVKANGNTATDVSGGDTVSFNDGSNIEITQNGTNFTIATKKDVNFDSVVANTFTAGTNVLNGTGLTVGNTAITTAGLTNGNTTITGTGVMTDTVTADAATIGGKVSINSTGINAGNTVITNVASGGTTDSNAANIGDVKKAVANLSQNLTISDGTTDGTVDLKNQKLTVTGTGAATATVSGQSITVNVAEGKLTPNATDGTVVDSATGVAKAADVAAAINNTNTVLTGKIDANTTKINTNKANIDANKTAIAKNVTDITNLGNNTFTLNGDSTSTTAQALNKNGGLSFKVAGDGKYISTAAAGDTVTVSLNEQAIKDTAKFKVKANGNTATDVSGGDTVSFNDGSNIEITQNGTNFTIATKKDVNFDSVVANTFTAGTNVLNGTGLTVGNTAITTAGLTNGNTTITGTGVTTDTVTAGSVTATGAVTAGSATIGGKVSINNTGIHAGNTVITNVASGGTTDTNAANIGDVKRAVANLSQNLTISDGTTNGTVDLKNQKLTVTGTGAATATVNGQSIIVNVVEGSLTSNTTDGTVEGSATGVAKAADVAEAINNTNTVLTNKIDANTTKINTNKANIDANKTAIAKNATAITNLGNNTFTLNGDSTSTTAQTLNKNGGLSFKVAGDGKYISTAAAGDTVTVSLNEQAIKDTAKSSVKFKVKANANAEEVVNADDTIAFNDGSNIEITQNGTNFTIATKKDVTFDSVVANTFTAGTNILNGTGLTVGNTVITTTGLTNGHTTITGTGVMTDTVTAGTVTADAATIGGKVSINSTGINAGNTVITNVAAGTADTDAVNVGQLKQQIKEATDTRNIRINYKANGGASESVSLSDGFDFKNGHLTTTEVGPNGAVKVNVVEGKIDITNGTATASQPGVATASDVADAINHIQTSVSNGRIDFSGDNKDAADPSTTLSRGFNQALEFVGGADVANLSDRNIGVNVVANKMEIKLAKELTGLTSSTFTDGTGNTTVVNGTGISIQGPTGSSQAPTPVTLTATGLDNGGNRITNVADGVDDTDVATVGQLRNMGSNTAMAITNLQRESQRIGAQSAAMAALKPIQYDPLEPTQIMAGIGNYRGETAGALGIAHYTNENTMFHIGATIGNDNNMVNAGVTHKFGSSAEKADIPDRYKAGPISSMYVMQTEMSQLQKENREQKEVIAAQQKSIDELKAAVAVLLARE